MSKASGLLTITEHCPLEHIDSEEEVSVCIPMVSNPDEMYLR